MGCQCTKKNEISNVNLQDDTLKNPQLNNTTEDNSEFLNNTKNNKNDTAFDTVNDVHKEDANDSTVRKGDNHFNNQNSLDNYSSLSLRVFDCLNRFRADPSSLGDLLMGEIKNISLSKKNGKEVYIYKKLYCISGSEELFIQVANVLKTLNPLEPLEFSQELVLEPENVPDRKPLNQEDKLALQREKDADTKKRFKNLKEKFKGKYSNIEILSHATSEEIEDAIVMQIVSNFNAGKNSKAKRPFDIIFGEQYKYVGVQLKGEKKMNGHIIFAC